MHGLHQCGVGLRDENPRRSARASAGLGRYDCALGQVDAREIIRNAVAADERNWKIARNYTFLQRVELRRLDSQGRVKSSEVQTYDVTLQEGTPYRQLVQKDDRPLPATEEKKEQESLAKSIAAAKARDCGGAGEAPVRIRGAPGLAA